MPDWDKGPYSILESLCVSGILRNRKLVSGVYHGYTGRTLAQGHYLRRNKRRFLCEKGSAELLVGSHAKRTFYADRPL
jgi:hypothetical protein